MCLMLFHPPVVVHVIMPLRLIIILLLIVSIYASPGEAAEAGFSWPISCVPGVDCAGSHFRIGYPDVNGTGLSFACGRPGYLGHQGTDIVVSSVEQGVRALAAADGTVRWTADGRFDRCPDDAEKECSEEVKSELSAGSKTGATLGFNAGNYVALEHTIDGTRYLTLYAHLRKGSLQVVPGQKVVSGQHLGDVASSGNSQIPHLHFGVYKAENSMYLPVDPWKGACNASSEGLWASSVPYRSDDPLVVHPTQLPSTDSGVYYQTIQRSRPKKHIY